MKDSCDLIQDLYPLYVEDELSPTVKEMVEEHLRSCADCSLVYESGEGFTEARIEETQDVPKSLDDRVKLKLKFRRMKFIAIILAVIISGMILNKYENSRQEVFDWTDSKYAEARDLKYLVESVKQKDLNSFKFNKKVYTERRRVDIDSVNWLEQARWSDTKSFLIIEETELLTTLEMLQHKHQSGEWDDVDRKTYKRIIESADQYMMEVEEEAKKFHHGYSSYLELIDFKGLDQPITAMNELSYHYNRFHQLPEDVERLNEDELRKQLSEILEVDASDVKFYSRSNEIGKRGFSIQDQYNGIVDEFSGNLIRLSHGLPQSTKQEPLSEEDAKKKAVAFLNRVYGDNADFKVQYEGKNQYTHSDREDYHSFKFQPVNNGYTLLGQIPHSDYFVIEVNIQTGNVDRFFINGTYLNKSFFQKDFIEETSSAEGLEILHEKVAQEDAMYTLKRKYKAIGTFIVPSRKSGDYELVHAYDLANTEALGRMIENEDRRYINAETGEEEFHYVLFY